MTDRFDPRKSAQMLSGPPTLRYRSNEGEWVEESQVLVGWVRAPEDRRRYLTDHGIDLRYASFNPDTHRWDCCLFSEGVADMLVELVAEGDFHFAFEAKPSWAELDGRLQQARGESARPEQPLRMYVTEASDEVLDAWRKHSGHDLVRRATPVAGDNPDDVPNS